MVAIAALPERTRGIPSRVEIDLANYKIGSYLSDLDMFARSAEKAAERTAPVDLDGLAHVIVFATDALQDAQAVVEYARRLQRAAFSVYHEAETKDGAQHWQRVRAWHRQEAGR